MKDQGLQGNETIEEGLVRFNKERTEENLAVVLTSIRRRMQEHGQMVVPVEAAGNGDMRVRIMKSNGKNWLGVFTSFEEELEGNSSIVSTFMADIEQILNMGLNEPSLEGIVINPWTGKLFLNKTLLRVIGKRY